MNYIRISESGEHAPGEFTYEELSDQWGTATINGVEYSACVSHDGDGVIVLADGEVDRYLENNAGVPAIEGI